MTKNKATPEKHTRRLQQERDRDKPGKHCLRQEKKLACRVRAEDPDFWMAFPDNTVEVSFHVRSKRLSIWGFDDIGMEKSSPATREEYDLLCRAPMITLAMCKKMGFESA